MDNTDNNSNEKITNIFHNAENDKITIILSNDEIGQVSVAVLDSQGTVISGNKFMGNIHLKVSCFTGGVYYIKIESNDVNELRKIIIV